VAAKKRAQCCGKNPIKAPFRRHDGYYGLAQVVAAMAWQRLSRSDFGLIAVEL